MSSLLRDVADYSDSRISLDEINVETYVTTDNLLQNKQGKVSAVKMPKQASNTVTRFDKGDVLVANIRPYLKKIWLAKYSGGSSTDVLTFKVKEGFDATFVYYALFRDDFFEHMMNGSKGTKMPRGDKNQILDFTIPDFDICNQKQIAKVLSDLDDKIELNNKINTELEAMAKLIYDYWFVQFDFPDNNGNPFKSSGGKMVFNAELNREIPEGWEVKRFDQILSQITDSIEPHEYPQLQYLPIDKLPTKKLYYQDYDSRDEANSSLIRFQENDILLGAMRVYFHRVCNAIEDGISRSTMMVLRPIVSMHKNFALFTLNRNEAIEYATKNSTGTSIPYAKWSYNLESYKFSMPSNEELITEFNETVDPIIENFKTLSKENQKLVELRDWLLPMLMNGQVRVN